MALVITDVVHPYLREIAFSEREVAAFPRLAACPACGSRRDPAVLIELGQVGWATCLSLVQCADCDHVFYRNPPPPEFFTRFYATEWNAGREDPKRLGPSRKTKGTTASLAADLGLADRGIAILEIGCGLGAMLAGLQATGFKELYGTEASDYRAAATAARFPDRIFPGGYESVPDGLAFGFIYSNHVVEHLFLPRDALAWMLARLKPDGIIAMSVPEARGEPVVGQVLFLPHLHSFCRRSLVAMGRSLGLDCLFWKGANEPYEVTAVFYRAGSPPRLRSDRFRTPDSVAETAPYSQADRIQGAFRAARVGGAFNLALQADEEDSIRLARSGGTRQYNPLQRFVGRRMLPVARILSRLGLRTLGNKRLARIRYIAGQMIGQERGAPVIGSADGKALLLIK